MVFVFNRGPFWEAGILPLNYSRTLAFLLLSSIGTTYTSKTLSIQSILSTKSPIWHGFWTVNRTVRAGGPSAKTTRWLQRRTELFGGRIGRPEKCSHDGSIAHRVVHIFYSTFKERGERQAAAYVWFNRC